MSDGGYGTSVKRKAVVALMRPSARDESPYGLGDQEKEDPVGDGCLRSETGRKRDDDKTIAHKT